MDYSPGTEIGTAVVVEKRNGSYLLRCECQCAFVATVAKVERAMATHNHRLGCTNCVEQWTKEMKFGKTVDEARQVREERKPCENVLKAFRLRRERNLCTHAIAHILGVKHQTVDNYFLRWAGRMGE